MSYVYFAVEHEPGDGNFEAFGFQTLRSREDQRLARHVLRKGSPNPEIFSYCLVSVDEVSATEFEDGVLDVMTGVYRYARASREAMRRRFIRPV